MLLRFLEQRLVEFYSARLRAGRVLSDEFILIAALAIDAMPKTLRLPGMAIAGGISIFSVSCSNPCWAASFLIASAICSMLGLICYPQSHSAFSDVQRRMRGPQTSVCDSSIVGMFRAEKLCLQCLAAAGGNRCR